MTAVAIERRTAIVVTMKDLVDAYNAGARRVVLSVVEQSGQPTVNGRHGVKRGHPTGSRSR
jgi:hypothetical protein